MHRIPSELRSQGFITFWSEVRLKQFFFSNRVTFREERAPLLYFEALLCYEYVGVAPPPRRNYGASATLGSPRGLVALIYIFLALSLGCDHTSTNALDPIRTPQISVLGPEQY
ncbi:hypothetical protein OWV82_022676 [Melia azedarach]|uniref:Uncharacterized protein n=1 Tax=Melia azedarach TaxID=155640 RepID=A0ACC1WU39_MELAZ|nr:hypothetical protein OWV82_022676 [Melia azedarach]